MPRPEPLVTADDLAGIPDDDYRYELVAGRVIRMSPPGSLHGVIAIRLGSLLQQHAAAHSLGAVMAETGFKLASNPDTVRGPDLAFVRRERIPPTGLPEGFWTGAPDLAVEIRSPDDRLREIDAKVAEYLASGARLVWVVDPRVRTITAYRRSAPPLRADLDGVIDGGDVLPGFRCAVRALFA